MRELPDKSIDLTVTSPPYDNLREYKGYVFNFEETAKELYRVTKDGGVVVWVVGDATINGSETGTSFKQALYFKEIGFKLHDTMIYMKNGPAYPSKNQYYSIFEYMFIFTKGSLSTFNPLKDRVNRWAGEKWSNSRSRRNKEGELKTGVWKADQGGKYGVRFNIWKYNVGHGYSTKDEIAYEHPATFPEQLATDHILSWSNEGDMVLDPFMGSGTTGKMATIHERKFIGFEIAKEYFDIAEIRINNAEGQDKISKWFE
jgi:site-specific DNA-methyltransferase (adenine-specific)